MGDKLIGGKKIISKPTSSVYVCKSRKDGSVVDMLMVSKHQLTPDVLREFDVEVKELAGDEVTTSKQANGVCPTCGALLEEQK